MGMYFLSPTTHSWLCWNKLLEYQSLSPSLFFNILSLATQNISLVRPEVSSKEHKADFYVSWFCQCNPLILYLWFICILINIMKKYSLPSSLQRLCSHESNLSQAFPRLTGEHGLQLKTEYWRRKGSANRGDSEQHFFSPRPAPASLLSRPLFLLLTKITLNP